MKPDMSKRLFLGGVATVGAALVAGVGLASGKRSSASKGETFEVNKTPAEWRRILPPDRYAVLREQHTERPGSSPLNTEHRKGIFACAGCNLPLYSSAAKFESGTGWPSFTAPLPDAVRTRPDGFAFFARTEVHCRRCGGHLGHVFDDGPPPMGKRYCMNGDAMLFRIA